LDGCILTVNDCDSAICWQLPTSDPDEPRFGSHSRGGFEMVGGRSRRDNFDTLPEAEEENEYGLPEEDDDTVRL